MKKLAILLIFCVLLTACAQGASTKPEATIQTAAAEETPVTLYTPNENADGFQEVTVHLREVNAQTVVAELIRAGVLRDDTVVNAAQLDGTQLTLDFNTAFRDQLFTYGSAGEQMMIGSVVNTFLGAFGAQSVMITVDGAVLESGHVIYDTPMEFFDLP